MSSVIERLLSVPMPPQIKRLKQDPRGFPIPASVFVDRNGRHDFRIIDLEKWSRSVRKRTCGICGEKLGPVGYFIGGPLSIANRAFFDLPMHEECARYALRVCPYLALPRFEYAQAVGLHLSGATLQTMGHVSTERPEGFGLYPTRTWERVDTAQGPYLAAGAPCGDIDFFIPSTEWKQEEDT